MLSCKSSIQLWFHVHNSTQFGESINVFSHLRKSFGQQQGKCISPKHVMLLMHSDSLIGVMCARNEKAGDTSAEYEAL